MFLYFYTCNIVSLRSVPKSNQNDGDERKVTALDQGQLHPGGAAAQELEVILRTNFYFLLFPNELFFCLSSSLSTVHLPSSLILTVASTSRTIALPREARAIPAWPARTQASCCFVFVKGGKNRNLGRDLKKG